MISNQITDFISPFGDYIAQNTTIIVFFTIAVGIIILLTYTISRIYKNNESMKNEFITIIAHKYNTPLTKIKWLLETLISDEQDSYKKENLREIHKANEQLVKLTGTLIELTDTDRLSKTTYSFEKSNICDLVKRVADEQKNSFHEKNVFFSTSCSRDDIFAKVDKKRMEFVIQVLMQNACIYTPPGKKVDVTVSKFGSKVHISITDTGIGIDHPDLSRIFTKFYRTKNAQMTDTEGLGVGLYLARSIVRKHKGKIEVFSEGLDHGSTFTIILPAIN